MRWWNEALLQHLPDRFSLCQYEGTSFTCQRNILRSETAQHWQSCLLFIPGCGAAQWVWFLRANHPSCSDPLKNAGTSPRCHVPPQNSGLEIKGCISGSGSRCPSSRHGLCNGPLMAATNDQQPEALPPETVGPRLLTSTDSVCSSVLFERIVCDGDSAGAGSLRRPSKVHSFWDSWMSVCLATHSSPDGDYNCLYVQMCCSVSISV